jgi:Mg-chelatase subunit ChlI
MGTVKNLNNFPFAAIIGQRDEISSQICYWPKIGGVIMGDRGTGKSTTIRAYT